MKVLMNIASFYWIIIFYFVHNEIFIIDTLQNYKILTILIYILFGFLLGWVSLEAILDNSDNYTGNNLSIKKIYPIYTELMPVFLAIIVIAFELNNYLDVTEPYTVLALFFGIFFLFSISNIGYLNPVWFLLGYRIYKVDNEKGIYILIVHKGIEYKSVSRIDNIKKIDEFVFIKRKK